MPRLTKRVGTFHWDTVQHDQNNDERQPLLGDEEADSDGLYPPFRTRTTDDPWQADEHSELPVYLTIHRIRRDIIQTIDDPYSLEQLEGPRLNETVVRPLIEKLYNPDDISIVYCLLVNRVEFLKEQTYQAHHQTVSITRALLCELVATRILRRFSEDNDGPKGLLKLAKILVAGFEPFQNAPPEVAQENVHAMHWATQKRGGTYHRKLTALEIAIISESKMFLASSACQKVVDSIYKGRIVYSPHSWIDIIPDHYKQKAISLYDPRRAPLLNQYRLIVPRTRMTLEVLQFIVLLILYILIMGNRNDPQFGPLQIVFAIYTSGWILDQFASILEHGWSVYTQNLWSFLDVTFAMIFTAYLVLRLHGIANDNENSNRLALDILSIGAPVLIPRLAFNLMSENMLFVSLRAMMADFTLLTFLAVWCFAGFLLSLKWLHDGLHESVTIAKWMLWIFFGLDGTGIQRSVDFHWLLGPIVMVVFAFIGNTLFITILVSMLSNTFATIVNNAAGEIQFRRTVLTFEGVKSDAIFAYQPPMNILALFTLVPLKFVLSDRWFHKVNVTAVRVLNAPLLLLISYFERQTLWQSSRRVKQTSSTKVVRPRLQQLLEFWDFSRFSVHGDLAAVFDCDVPEEIVDEINGIDPFYATSDSEGVKEPTKRLKYESKTHEEPGVSVTCNGQDQRPGRRAQWSDNSPRTGSHATGCLPEHLHELIHETNTESKQTKKRLEEVERGVKRIERLLEKLLEQNM